MSSEGNGWQTVSKKGSKKKGPRRMLSVLCEERASNKVEGIQNIKDDYHRILLKIQQLKEELRTSELWDSFQNTIQNCFKKCLVQRKENPQCFTETKCISAGDTQQPEPVHKQVAQYRSEKQGSYFREGREDQPTSCVCYGIGQFSYCVISRYQLAFLLLILEKLQILKCQCHVFDPLFSSSEIEVLKALGFSVILENEEGKRSVVCTTVFYMIHCDKALYNNLLWKNWSVDNLSKLFIIGNSFQGFEERLPTRILESNYAYISKVLKLTEETLFPHTTKYADIFNDTALHWFPLQKLKELQNDIWLLRDEPEYDKEENMELIRNEKKLN